MPTESPSQLVVFGCGSQALYVIDALAACGLPAPLGLVDIETGGMVGKNVMGVPVRWDLEQGLQQAALPGHRALMAHGDNQLKLNIADRLERSGVTFASVQHPRAGVSPLAKIAAGCILCPSSEILPGAVLEPHTIVHAGAVVEHDCWIGRGTNIAPGVSLAGRVKIGEGSYVYTGASIGPMVSVGAWAIIGAGTIVRHDIASHEVHVGNPARKLHQSKTK